MSNCIDQIIDVTDYSEALLHIKDYFSKFQAIPFVIVIDSHLKNTFPSKNFIYKHNYSRFMDGNKSHNTYYFETSYIETTNLNYYHGCFLFVIGSNATVLSKNISYNHRIMILTGEDKRKIITNHINSLDNKAKSLLLPKSNSTPDKSYIKDSQFTVPVIIQKSQSDNFKFNNCNMKKTYPSSPLDINKCVNNCKATDIPVFRKLKSDLEKKIEKLQEDILFQTRMITLHLYYSSDCKSDCLQPPDMMNTRLFNPITLRSYVGITNLAQASSTLISYLIRNPIILEQVVLSRNDDQEFLHLAFSAIPSIFGFFSSHEMVELAYIFYVHITEIPNTLIVTRLLMPFINSGLSVQFISTIMHKFFQLYTPDAQIIDGEAFKIIVPEYAATLIRYCIEWLHLLSNEIIYILQLLIERGWSDTALLELFFDRFIFPYMRTWARKIISKDKWELIEEILSYVKNCESEIRSFKDSILATTGMFMAPYFNCGGDHQPFRHFVCVNDIVMLGIALHDINLMPKTISINDFVDISEKKKFSWFWTEIYLKKQTSLVCKLFSKDDELGQEFDNLIDLRFDLSQLSNWDEILDRHILSTMDLMTNRVVISIPQKELMTVHSIYFKYESLFRSRTLKQLFTLSTIRSMITHVPSRYIRRVIEIGHLWIPFMSRAHTFLRLPNFDTLVSRFRPSSQLSLLTAMRCFRMIDFVPINVQFYLIVRALKHIEHVANNEFTGDLLYCLLFERMESEAFLASFILLSAFAMKNDFFAGLLSSEVIELWSKCDTVILNCLAFDPEFMDQVIEISQELTSFACPSPSIKKAESAPLLSLYY